MSTSPSRRSQLAVALGVIASAATYHWFPNGFLPASYWPVIALFLPATAAAILFSLQSLWNRDAFRDRDAESEATFHAIVFRVTLFLMVLHGLLLGALTGSLNSSAWAPRVVVVLFGVLVMSVGNLLPRTRPNLEFGIRTSRALGDRRVWIQTHRVAGYAGVCVGATIVICGLFLSRWTSGPVVLPAALLAATVVMVSHYKFSRG